MSERNGIRAPTPSLSPTTLSFRVINDNECLVIRKEISHDQIVTRVIGNPSDIINRAKYVTDTSNFLFVCSSLDWLKLLDLQLFQSFIAVLERNAMGEHGGIKWIGQIRDQSDVVIAKKFLSLGMQIRHIDSIPINFSLTDKELNLAPIGPDDVQTENNSSLSTLVTNYPRYIQHFRKLFEEIWKQGLNATQRIYEIETGIEIGETRIITDSEEARGLSEELIENCKEEVLVILPPEKDIVRNDDFLQKLERTQVRIRILSPEEDERKFSSQLGIEWRRIVPINLGVAIYDKSKMLITQNENPSEVTNRSSLQLVSHIFTTNKQTIAGVVKIFQALWSESELRLAEQKSRQRAELLQDVPTHDIRNYNQIALLQIEFLSEELKDNSSAMVFSNNILDAIQGTTVSRFKSRATNTGSFPWK